MGSGAGGSTRDMVGAAVASSFLGSLPGPLVDLIRQGSTLHHVATGQVVVDVTEPD